jgi:hypothetical protein
VWDKLGRAWLGAGQAPRLLDGRMLGRSELFLVFLLPLFSLFSDFFTRQFLFIFVSKLYCSYALCLTTWRVVICCPSCRFWSRSCHESTVGLATKRPTLRAVSVCSLQVAKTKTDQTTGYLPHLQTPCISSSPPDRIGRCGCVFIGMSTRTCTIIYVCTVFLKKKSVNVTWCSYVYDYLHLYYVSKKNRCK